jgi:hypothetical protein
VSASKQAVQNTITAASAIAIACILCFYLLMVALDADKFYRDFINKKNPVQKQPKVAKDKDNKGSKGKKSLVRQDLNKSKNEPLFYVP